MTTAWLYSDLVAWFYSALAAIEAMSIKDIVTLSIAAYGALLSTFMFVRSWRKDRRRVRTALVQRFCNTATVRSVRE